MVDKNIFRVNPKRFKCFFCDKWHNLTPLGNSKYSYRCRGIEEKLWFDFDYDKGYITTTTRCKKNVRLPFWLDGFKIDYDSKQPRITREFLYGDNETLYSENCKNFNCHLNWHCNGGLENIETSFEFPDTEEVRKILGIQETQDFQNNQENEKYLQQNNIECKTTTETKSRHKKVTIREQLWEHSPKENFEIFKNWCAKYKGTFQWAIPIAIIYCAYKILNSKKTGLTTDNINNECKKKLGFSFECLKNNKKLKSLLIFGGMSATAATLINVLSSISNKNNKNNLANISTEEIEDGLENVEKAHKNFRGVTPETERLLPVAISVIIVYLMTQKPEWFEKIKSKVLTLAESFSDKALTYLELAKLFIADKLHIDLDNEEECKKFRLFALLGIAVVIGVVLYGKSVLGKSANTDDSEQNSNKNKNFEIFATQVLEIMKKLMPTAFAGITTFLVTKHVLKDTEPDSSNIDSCLNEMEEKIWD